MLLPRWQPHRAQRLLVRPVTDVCPAPVPPLPWGVGLRRQVPGHPRTRRPGRALGCRWRRPRKRHRGGGRARGSGQGRRGQRGHPGRRPLGVGAWTTLQPRPPRSCGPSGRRRPWSRSCPRAGRGGGEERHRSGPRPASGARAPGRSGWGLPGPAVPCRWAPRLWVKEGEGGRVGAGGGATRSAPAPLVPAPLPYVFTSRCPVQGLQAASAGGPGHSGHEGHRTRNVIVGVTGLTVMSVSRVLRASGKRLQGFGGGAGSWAKPDPLACRKAVRLKLSLLAAGSLPLFS